MKRFALMLVLVLGAVGWGDISISPTFPRSGDQVYITISVRALVGFRIDRVSSRRQGETVLLDVEWIVAAVGSWERTLYEHTHLAGTFAPGIYTVKVSHRGALTRNESTTFMVGGFEPSSEPPSDVWSLIGDRRAIVPPSGPPVVEPFPILGNCVCHRWPELFHESVCPFCGRQLAPPGTVPDELSANVLPYEPF